MPELLTDPAIHRYLIAFLFCGMGLLHFLKPAPFIRVMPDYLPRPRAMVYISGVAELAGGIGILLPAWQVVSAWGLLLLLLAVFPANIDMAGKAYGRYGFTWYTGLLAARLPLQFLLMYWVYWAGISSAV